MYSSRFTLAFSTVLFACAPANAKATWQRFTQGGKVIDRTHWFNDEGGYLGKSQLSPISGMECYGHYCDYKRVFTVRDGANPPVQDEYYWITHWTSKWFSDNPPLPNRADCPSHMVVYAIGCRGHYCDDMILECGALISGYRVVSTDKKNLPWLSEEQGRRDCPDGYYVSGMACQGHYCDNIQLTCVRIDSAVPTKPWRLLTRDGNIIVYSKHFNEHGGGYSELMKGPVAGIDCIGDSCDTLQLAAVQRFPNSYIVEKTEFRSNWFGGSYGNHYASCPEDMVVHGIGCRYKGCGQMRLLCGRASLGYVIKSGYTLTIVNFYWKGMRFCPNGYYVSGIDCISNCILIRLTCVAIEYAP